MVSRGRKPKPTHLKTLEGTRRVDRLNPDEPQVEAELPECPGHLSPEAMAEWARVTQELMAVGLLTRLDRAALAAYCQAWARWVEAEEALRSHGTLVRAPSGFPMQSPYLAVANKALDQMRQLLQEFGMTPSSRTRVKAEPVRGDDDAVRRWLADGR